eukprot:scaffold2246_cov162-Amphora_coffeaeformis.AAC.32
MRKVSFFRRDLPTSTFVKGCHVAKQALSRGQDYQVLYQNANQLRIAADMRSLFNMAFNKPLFESLKKAFNKFCTKTFTGTSVAVKPAGKQKKALLLEKRRDSSHIKPP